MPRAQHQHRKREVIAWTAPPAAIQLKAFPRTRCPNPTASTAECRRLIFFRLTLSDTGPHAGVACVPRPCRSSTMSPSNIVSNSNITCSSLSNRAFAMKPSFIEGLPISTVRHCSHRLMFVPAGRMFSGAQRPRLLTRAICLYIDPHTVPVDPDFRFAEAELQPRLLFEDAGLAAWQQKRVMDFIEEHLSEEVSLDVLADLVRLSPFHFLRSFKQSFGEPPYRYWTGRRIERAKALLASPRTSVTEIALDVGFHGTSAFSATFHRVTGQTPTDYRRDLE